MNRQQMLAMGTMMVRGVASANQNGERPERAEEDILRRLLSWTAEQASKRGVSLDDEWEYRNRAELSFAQRWAMCGAPNLTAGHRLAASMMATKIPIDLLCEVAHPWLAYCVSIPRGILGFVCPTGCGHQVDHVRVIADPGGRDEVYLLAVYADDGSPMALTIYERPKPLARAVGDVAESMRELSSGWGAQGIAAAELALRFALGSVVHLEASGQHDHAKARQPSVRRNIRKSGAPESFTFQLKGEVRVDCRGWSRDYVASGGKSPAVQCLVRGHWKRQSWGAGSRLRKWIHVEPYWRGPEEAPIAVRSHIIGGAA